RTAQPSASAWSASRRRALQRAAERPEFVLRDATVAVGIGSGEALLRGGEELRGRDLPIAVLVHGGKALGAHVLELLALLVGEPLAALARDEFLPGQDAVAVTVEPIERLLPGGLALGRAQRTVAVGIHLL